MGDIMTFPASVEEFMEQYKMTDTEHVYSNGTEYVPIYRMKQWFEHVNSCDFQPVRHGKWDHNSDFPDRFICYGCGAMFDMWKHEQRLFSYCPNCGAKMDLEVLIDG